MFVARRGQGRYVLAELLFCIVAYIVPAFVLGTKLLAKGNYPALLHTIALACFVTYTCAIADCVNDASHSGVRHWYYRVFSVYLAILVASVISGLLPPFSIIRVWLPAAEIVYAYSVTLLLYWPLFKRHHVSITKHFPT